MDSTTNSTNDDKDRMLVAAGFSRLFSDIIQADNQIIKPGHVKPPAIAKPEVKGWTFKL